MLQGLSSCHTSYHGYLQANNYNNQNQIRLRCRFRHLALGRKMFRRPTSICRSSVREERGQTQISPSDSFQQRRGKTWAAGEKGRRRRLFCLHNWEEEEARRKEKGEGRLCSAVAPTTTGLDNYNAAQRANLEKAGRKAINTFLSWWEGKCKKNCRHAFF